MKAFIVNGSQPGDTAAEKVKGALAAKLAGAGWEAEAVDLADKKIAYCTGCFGCWIKTPGECVVDDYSREFARKVVQSDLVVLLTPVTFGGYSSELKKVVDHMIPDIMPYFVLIHGEMHHGKRYDRYPSLLGIGLLPEADEAAAAIFGRLVERNAYNFYSPTYATCTFVRSRMDGLERDLAATLGKVGVTA